MAGAAAVADPPATGNGKVGEKGLETLKDAAGEAVGPMPPKDPEAQPEPEAAGGQMRVDGTTELGKLKAGGKPATHSTLKFEGIKELELADRMAFEKGNVVYFTGIATILDVGQRDKRDTVTKQVVDCKQRHAAAVDELRVVTEPCVPISGVQSALSEIAELAATGEADIPSAIEDAIDKLASLS